MDEEFYNGTNIFILPNGDSYLGEYCAHISGKIWREGEGVYQTADGQFYEGEWKNDKLVENRDVEIVYKDKSVYNGPLLKNKYDGVGTFTYANGIKFFCNFSANKPVGDVLMADIDGRLWRGVAIEDKVDLSPENLFFKNIQEHRGKSKLILKQLEPDWKPTIAPSVAASKETMADSLTDKYWESIVFAKSTKTDTKIDLTDSDWYRKFASYKCKRAIILEKVKNHTKLTKKEASWYMNYANYKRKMKDKKILGSKIDPAKVDTSLLEKFFSREYAESFKPYSVIYPSYKWKIKPESEEASYIPIEEIEESNEEESSVSDDEVEFESESVTEEKVVEEELKAPSAGVGTASLYSLMDEIAGKKKLRSCKWDESSLEQPERKACKDLVTTTKSCRDDWLNLCVKSKLKKVPSKIEANSCEEEESEENLSETNID